MNMKWIINMRKANAVGLVKHRKRKNAALDSHYDDDDMMYIRQYKSLSVNQASSECAARAKTHVKVHVKVIQRKGE
jgi:hypothetical protein